MMKEDEFSPAPFPIAAIVAGNPRLTTAAGLIDTIVGAVEFGISHPQSAIS
jgi:hypothetical protein